MTRAGRSKADGLDRRHRQARRHGREVRGKDEIRAALDHLQLAPQSARGPAEVRGGDDVEHDLGRRGDVQRDRAERPQPAADADVERQAGARDERGPRGDHGAGEGGTERTCHRFVLHGWDTSRVAAPVSLPATTRSICPHCGVGLDAELIERDGRVILRRECPEHGLIEALAYGDSDRWREAQRYDRPGAAPLLRQTVTDQGCPRDCGICPEHAQHTCLGIIEVNTGCNLDCPVCFAESGTGHQPDGYSLSLAQVESMLDAFVAAEGQPEAVQLSGGEPLDPSRDPRHAGRREGARNPARDAQHQRHPAGARRALRARARRTRGPRLSPVRRLRRCHPSRHSRSAPSVDQAGGARQLRRRRGRRLAGRRGRARHQRARARRDRAIRRRASRRQRRLLPATGDAHRTASGLQSARPAHQRRGDPRAVRAAARVVPRGRLRCGAVLLADLPFGDLRALRRRGPRSPASARRRRPLPRLRCQPRGARP